MGSLNLPTSGLVYADTQIAIYSSDGHPTYAPLCVPLWQPGGITIITSELTLLETLVIPMRTGDAVLATRRENLWYQANTRMVPITQQVLREAARLRATIPGIKTPDAIHAATAIVHGCVLFVTNDNGFRRVPSMPLVILDDVLAMP